MDAVPTESCLCCGDATSDYLEHLLELHKFSLAKAREVIRTAYQSGDNDSKGANKMVDIGAGGLVKDAEPAINPVGATKQHHIEGGGHAHHATHDRHDGQAHPHSLEHCQWWNSFFSQQWRREGCPISRRCSKGRWYKV